MKKAITILIYFAFGITFQLTAQEISYEQQISTSNKISRLVTSDLRSRDSIAKEVKIYLSNSPDELSAVFNYFLGKYYSGIGDYKQALTYSHNGISKVMYLPDSLDLYHSLLYSTMGGAYTILKKYDSANWAYNQALTSLDMAKHGNQGVHLYLKLANLALGVYDNLELAKEYYDKASKNRLLYQDTIYLDWELSFGYGKYYFKRGVIDSAKYYYLKYIDYGELLGPNKSIASKAIAFSYLASINFESQNYKEALKYDLLSLNLELKTFPIDSTNIIASYNNLGEDYLLISKPDSAFYYYKKALDLSEKLRIPERKIEVLNNLHEFYAQTGHLKKAYELLSERSQIFDTLITYKNDLKYNELLRQYESEKQLESINIQKNQITLLETKEELANLRMMVGFVFVLIVMAIGFMIARTRVKSKERKAKEFEKISQFKEAMTGMIAHDLKNPLSVIMNNTAEIPSTKHMASQMLHLINNMLDVHKFESTEIQLHTESLGVLNIFNEVNEQIRPLLSQKNIKLIVQVKKKVTVIADRDTFFRTIINLLTNAIKYSEVNSEIVLSAVPFNDKIKISVQDFGKGIPSSEQDRLFGSFQQLDPKESGGVGSTGLGLTFCKLAVEAHGSEIYIDSEVGKGTMFSFGLSGKDEDEFGTSVQISHPITTFTMSEKQRQSIIDRLPALKAMKVYQVSEIEDLFDQITTEEKEQLDDWIKAVLNAAYNNNQKHYDELLDRIS